MNIERARLLAAASLGLALCGCAATTNLLQSPGDATFGEANRQTMMAQVVDPDPKYDAPAVSSGEHAASAVERYRTDKVYQPETQQTTSGTSGSSGSSGPK